MQAGHDATVEQDLVMLREELIELKRQVQIIKKVIKEEIARYEIDQIKRGKDVESILDLI
jgi:hypothetical protein